MRILLPLALVAMVLAGCPEDDVVSCWGEGAELPEGRFEAQSGGWLAGSEARSVEIDYATGRAVVEFEKDGVRYRATYAIDQGLGYSAIKLDPYQREDDCATAEQQGAVIDAVLLKRGGKVISWAAYVSQSDAGGCPALEPEDLQRLVGEPDGKGLALGNRSLKVRFAAYAWVRPDDEIVVHASGGDYAVSVAYISAADYPPTPPASQQIGAGRGTRGWLVPSASY